MPNTHQRNIYNLHEETMIAIHCGSKDGRTVCRCKNICFRKTLRMQNFNNLFLQQGSFLNIHSCSNMFLSRKWVSSKEGIISPVIYFCVKTSIRFKD